MVTSDNDDISELDEERTPTDDVSVNGTQHVVVPVDETEVGTRFDAFLAAKIADISRSRVKELIKQGQAMLNGAPCNSPNHRLQKGDRVSIVLPEAIDPEPQAEDIPLEVMYEDDDLIVINKPAGLVTHPGAGNWTGTLVNALIHHCGKSLSGIGGVRRPGIVHRLDKETSGLLVVAKNDQSHRGLSAQFADHGREGPLRRAYTALVWNAPPRKTGTINTQIARADHNRLKMSVIKSGGRKAITHYETVETYSLPEQQETAFATRILCTLETGRTHQIRVHLAHIGCPLVGDPVYGTGFQTKADRLPESARTLTLKLGRQALHAGRLAFEHPVTGETMHFETDLPSDLAALTAAFAGMGH